jgi:hypothetical protein
MYKDVGMFIDKGNDSELYHKIRSRYNKETDVEYYIRTGKSPRKGCCDLCKNLETKTCDSCTLNNLKFEISDMNELKSRRQKETQHGQPKSN